MPSRYSSSIMSTLNKTSANNMEIILFCCILVQEESLLMDTNTNDR